MKKSVSKSKISNKTDSSDNLGRLIIFSAPSGCGKTTIVERLLKRHPDWVRSVSATTRLAREGEKTGEDYFFVSEAEFRKLQEKEELLESAKVFDKHYGTPRSFVMDNIHQGKSVVLAIDIQGTKSIQKALGDQVDLITIFILPPSIKVLRERLEGRQTESSAQIDKRIQIAQDEIKEAGNYDFAVVNQNLDQTILEIEEKLDSLIQERRK